MTRNVIKKYPLFPRFQTPLLPLGLLMFVGCDEKDPHKLVAEVAR
jgi:hypothetical protein